MKKRSRRSYEINGQVTFKDGTDIAMLNLLGVEVGVPYRITDIRQEGPDDYYVADLVDSEGKVATALFNTLDNYTEYLPSSKLEKHTSTDYKAGDQVIFRPEVAEDKGLISMGIKSGIRYKIKSIRKEEDRDFCGADLVAHDGRQITVFFIYLDEYAEHLPRAKQSKSKEGSNDFLWDIEEGGYITISEDFPERILQLLNMKRGATYKVVHVEKRNNKEPFKFIMIDVNGIHETLLRDIVKWHCTYSSSSSVKLDPGALVEMIDLALLTRDKVWFSELVSQLEEVSQ